MRVRSLVLLVFSVAAVAQSSDPWKQSEKYDANIPTVQSVLGYATGEKYSPYSNIERYYAALAAKSDRIKLESYGQTYEGRKQWLLTISSPKNLARLDEIKANIGKLHDPRGSSAADTDAIANSTPIIVWLGYGVHGNESNSAEAAMQVAYELAASQDAKVLEWLENCVILIDPLTNPDGRERYVQYYNSTAGAQPVSDRFAAEQQERWPSGRFNHYYFDLNRDWAWQSQQETRNRMKVYLQWHPQVSVDLHEMGRGSTYFFAPPARPVHGLVRDQLAKWYDVYGKGNAAAFDKYGFRYFTKEVFDLLAPFYGDSWPALNGATGMTYEQAGGGAGLSVELEEGERTLTLKDRAQRHFIASLATIDTSSKNRAARLKDYAEFHRAAIRAGQTAKAKQFFIPATSDRADELVNLLMAQGIEVKRATAEFSITDAAGYWPPIVVTEPKKEEEKKADKKDDAKDTKKDDKKETKKEQAKTTASPAPEKIPAKFAAGTYIVDLAQPQGVLAQALLERDTKPEWDDFYDITAWALPYAFNVEAYSGSSSVAAETIKEPVRSRGEITGAQNATAYAIPWNQNSAPKVLARLLSNGVRAYVSIKPFKATGQSFSAGSIIIPTETNSANIHQQVRDAASKEGARVVAMTSALAESGVDLGSNNVRFLRKPRVAVITDTPTAASDYGAIWHYLEQEIGQPFTPIKAESLGNVNMSMYNVLIVPDGSDSGYARNLSTDKLRDWISGGGVLITMNRSTIWASKNKSGLASVGYKLIPVEDEIERLEADKKAKKDDDEDSKPSADEKKKLEQQKLDRKLMTWEQRERFVQSDQIPGAILRTKVDVTHPLGFGVGAELPVINNTAPILALTEKGENPIYYPKGSVKLSGFITEENEKKLPLTAWVVRERIGRGHVVLFSGSPLFRGFFKGSARVLLNAIYFGNVTNPNF